MDPISYKLINNNIYTYMIFTYMILYKHNHLCKGIQIKNNTQIYNTLLASLVKKIKIKILNL
jgi:hypothetical protein